MYNYTHMHLLIKKLKNTLVKFLDLQKYSQTYIYIFSNRQNTYKQMYILRNKNVKCISVKLNVLLVIKHKGQQVH